jgi:triacylglycerol lipase
MRTLGVVLLGAALVVAGVAPAAAYHDEHANHACPIEPFDVQYHFATTFRPPFDAETRSEEFATAGCNDEPWRVAGFGGKAFKPVPDRERIGASCRSKRRPVIFVHGNNVDAGDWYPALPVFADLGYTMCHLWGLSYAGVGGNNGNALHTRNPKAADERGDDGNTTRVTGNTINLPEVEGFIRKVLKHTRSGGFQIVAHSLGVTVVRKVLKDNPDLSARLEAFVAIAGANHGTSFCRGNEALLLTEPQRAQISCDEIAPDFPGYTNPWLADLNSGDETPGDARYLTVYDGSGSGDPAFVGPDSVSPRLDGALNCTFPGAYHNDLRIDPLIVRFYARFLAGKKRIDLEPGATSVAPEGSSCE